MQKYAENCSFYVLKVQKIWHKIVTFSAPNILDPLLTLNMHLIINNALLWDQKVLYWRDSEIIKGAGLVLRPTSVQCNGKKSNVQASSFNLSPNFFSLNTCFSKEDFSLYSWFIGDVNPHSRSFPYKNYQHTVILLYQGVI